MVRDYLSRLLGWLGGGDERRRLKQEHKDACEHGDAAACPYERENFDCSDCEVDEATGKMRPRL